MSTWTKMFKVSGQVLEQTFQADFCIHRGFQQLDGEDLKLTALNQESDSALSRGLDHMASRASFPPEFYFFD